ncbi:MAG: hypothetical protein FJ026_16510 [Chloroflexi bacterium]|nr:hypothetical protein [Chloroflexota bacterium]
MTKRVLKDTVSMPAYLSFPVSGQRDFDQIRERFDPYSDERYPADWDAFLSAYRNRDFPIGLSFLGFFAWPRMLMGFGRMLLAFYDQPELLQQMIDFWCNFVITLCERALEELDVDFVMMGEDMAYNHGPFMSPAHFRRFMLPGYRRLTKFIQDHGVDLIVVDSDGNVNALLPVLIEAGVAGIWPLEAQSGMDPVALRREYGQALVLWGGIDKRALAHGPRAIEAEVRQKVLPLVGTGGYIPSVDHFVPSDVPWDHYRLYLDLLRDANWNRAR